MRKILILLVLTISISCTKRKVKENTISGNIIGRDIKISLFLDSIDSNSNKHRIDSIMGIDSTFKFLLPSSDTLRNYHITFFNDSLKQPIFSIPIWFEKENVSVSINLNKGKSQTKGGTLNKIQHDFNSIFEKYGTPEIEKEIFSGKNQKENQLILEKYQKLIETERIALIYNKPNNIISLSHIIMLSKKISKDSLNLYYNLLDDKLKSSKKGQIIFTLTKKNKINIGDSIQDFTAYDLKGNRINLFSFKGKIILLDFWASWCKPCHQQNQNEFSELFKKYKNKNFVIISYSLDKESAKDNWEKASIEDNINWINISNLKGFKDPISWQYDISSIPNSFLINQKGIIVQSFSGYDPNNKIIEKEIIKLLTK